MPWHPASPQTQMRTASVTIERALTAPHPTTQRMLPWLLLLLTGFGPISLDLYLPALPALTAGLQATPSVAQLTVPACLIGLAGGQLVAGPVSDQYGRRRILIAGVIA